MQVYFLLAGMKPVTMIYLSLGILQGADSKELNVPVMKYEEKCEVFRGSKAFLKA